MIGRKIIPILETALFRSWPVLLLIAASSGGNYSKKAIDPRLLFRHGKRHDPKRRAEAGDQKGDLRQLVRVHGWQVRGTRL